MLRMVKYKHYNALVDFGNEVLAPLPSPSRHQWSPCQTKRSPESNLCNVWNVWRDNIVINTAKVDFGIIIIIIIITTSTMNITLIILIITMIETRCVIANLVMVDKDEAVVGVEGACRERLLNRLTRQLGRASHLVVVIGSRKSRDDDPQNDL